MISMSKTLASGMLFIEWVPEDVNREAHQALLRLTDGLWWPCDDALKCLWLYALQDKKWILNHEDVILGELLGKVRLICISL